MKHIVLALAFLAAASATANAQCASAQVPVRVYLMYGLVSAAMSSGMSDLVAKMNRIGNVKATVHEWLESGSIASDAANQNAAIVIGGHSIGANAAVSAARQMDGKKRVALILGFDPSSLSSLESVPPNVVRAIGFRQDHNPFGGNKLVAASGSTNVSNIFRDLNHIAIDKNDEIHRISMQAVCSISSRG
jgi:ABC-type branched-subunit amino acid transport system substrate-binding protein